MTWLLASLLNIRKLKVNTFDLYFVPKIFPIFTPANEIKNVQTPIIDAADTICTFKNANVIPTASASILVATASINISFISMDASAFSSSSDNDSFTILIPISPRRINAIQ